MANLMESLPWEDGQANPTGIKSTIYFIPKAWLSTIPTVDPAATTPEGNVNLNGDFACITGKKWMRLYTTQGKGKVWWEPLGEKDHKLFLNKGMFVYPDISAKARSLAKETINSNIICVVPMPHSSEKRFVTIGDNDYDVTVSIKGDSGAKPGEEKGITFEIESPCETPLPGYTGILEFADGTLDCETGVFTPTGG